MQHPECYVPWHNKQKIGFFQPINNHKLKQRKEVLTIISQPKWKENNNLTFGIDSFQHGIKAPFI
jgi:hypothetical protein